MIKRTLYFSNPFHLSSKLKQLVITNKETGEVKERVIEDIEGVLNEIRYCILTPLPLRPAATSPGRGGHYS